MSTVAVITIGEIKQFYVDADPSTSGGTAASPGSCAYQDNGNIYTKWGTNDTDWGIITSSFGSFVSGTINGKTTGSTLIGTTRSNGAERFYPQIAHIILASTTGFSAAPTITIGTNSSSYDNIVASTTLTGLNASNMFYALSLIVPQSSIAGSTGIYINVGTGATATTYTILALARGFYA